MKIVIFTLFMLIVASAADRASYYNPYTGGQSVCPQGGSVDACKQQIPPSKPTKKPSA